MKVGSLSCQFFVVCYMMDGHYFLFFHQTLNEQHGRVLPWVTLLRYAATEPVTKLQSVTGRRWQCR